MRRQCLNGVWHCCRPVSPRGRLPRSPPRRRAASPIRDRQRRRTPTRRSPAGRRTRSPAGKVSTHCCSVSYMFHTAAKKRKERTTHFSVDLMRSQVLYQAAQAWSSQHNVFIVLIQVHCLVAGASCCSTTGTEASARSQPQLQQQRKLQQFWLFK